jgi:predicted cobalt transporter CbtA
MTGSQRWVWTAALFAAALALLVVTMITHNPVPLFIMWAPLLVVPIVLGRPDPELRAARRARSSGTDPAEAGTAQDDVGSE